MIHMKDSLPRGKVWCLDVLGFFLDGFRRLLQHGDVPELILLPDN